MTISDEHSELFHYTTAAGLDGIVSSGCLWATHASFLNDTEEIKHLFGTRLLEIVKEILPEGQVPQIFPAKIEDPMELAKKLCDVLYETGREINQPYIFSMSSPRDDPRVARNGLLSQWRGYGVDGGYAVVFDTSGIEHLLRSESETEQYLQSLIGVVVYYGGEGPDQQVARLEEEVRADIRALILHLSARQKAIRQRQSRPSDPNSTEEDWVPPKLYPKLFTLSCLYKHWGFSEEPEVRIAASPLPLELTKGRPTKKVKNFTRDGMLVSYIELFDEVATGRLPIKRVIVGPHRDSTLRSQAVAQLLAANGYDPPRVECSQIPYIGR